MNKPVLEVRKILMYEFWHDYVKPKYNEKAKLCYMDKYSFIVYIKTDDIYKGITKDVETRFGTSNCELVGLLKDELGGKTMIKFVGLRAKTYSYLIDDGSEDKKAKGTKKFDIERKLKFEIIKSV